MKKLQQKWGVGPGRLVLILITFALGGSLTGWLGRKVMLFFGIEVLALYIPVYLVVITIIWPLMVLLVSIPFGQFPFFKTYLSRIARRFTTNKRNHADRP